MLGVPGFFAQSARMISRAMKHILEDNLQNKLDPVALPIPWNEAVRIGNLFSLQYAS